MFLRKEHKNESRSEYLGIEDELDALWNELKEWSPTTVEEVIEKFDKIKNGLQGILEKIKKLDDVPKKDIVIGLCNLQVSCITVLMQIKAMSSSRVLEEGIPGEKDNIIQGIINFCEEKYEIGSHGELFEYRASRDTALTIRDKAVELAKREGINVKFNADLK